MEQSPNLPQQNKLHRLAFWKVGLIEIFIVVFGLLILFGTLNYFNILPVSDVFPNQLGWLPQKEVPNGAPQNFSPVPKISPTPTGFQYDTRKAEILLIQYIKDTIRPEFLPANIQIKQGLSIDGRTEDIKNEFGYYLTVKDSTVSANFHYRENTNQQNDFSIFIQPGNVVQSTATVRLAESFLSSYFIAPYSISSCQQKGTTSYCENFQTLADGKRGYGIVYMNQGTGSLLMVFNCFVPKESKNYDTQKSCISP